jgi:hypothetical protein
LNTDYGIAAAGETSSRILRDGPNSLSTYIIVSNTANQAAVGSDTIQSIGTTENKCVLTTPTTTAWASNGTLYSFPQVYHLTLQDTVCGTSRLSEVQAAYPSLTVTQLADGPVPCIHQYETTIYSAPAAISCTVDQLVFPDLPAFLTTAWVPVTSTPSSSVKAGVTIETAFVNRITGDCTFDYFPYEADVVHIQVSEWNHDYNGSPCENRWPVTEIQALKYPVGVGAYVREQEKKSLSYFLMERSMDPAVREAEGFKLQTDPNAYYDEWTLHYDFKYKVGGWSQEYTDAHQLVIYVPEGGGQQLRDALVTYAESIGPNVDIELD